MEKLIKLLYRKNRVLAERTAKIAGYRIKAKDSTDVRRKKLIKRIRKLVGPGKTHSRTYY